MEDITLKCGECGDDFKFTVKEQEYYSKKGFKHNPSRCYECRTKGRYEIRNGVFLQGHVKEEEPPEEIKKEKKIVWYGRCHRCGGLAKLTFKPRYPWIARCEKCYRKDHGLPPKLN